MKKILNKTLIILLLLLIIFLNFKFDKCNAYGKVDEYDSIEEYYSNNSGWKSDSYAYIEYANIKDYSQLVQMSNLESLLMYYMEGEDLRFPELPNLKRLEIYESDFTSLDLTNLTGLEELVIESVNISDITIKNMPKLKKLTIYNNWQGSGKVNIVNTNNIQYLLVSNFFDIELQNCSFNNLKEVEFWGFARDGANMEFSNYYKLFASVPNISINTAKVSEADIDVFNNVDTLRLNACYWSGVITPKNPNLNELVVCYSGLSEYQKIDVTKLSNLRRFTYYEEMLGEEGKLNCNEFITSNLDTVVEINENGKYLFIGRENRVWKDSTLEQYIAKNYPNQSKQDITELEIKDTYIKDFRNLKQLLNLKKLTLKNMNLTSIDFKDLQNLEELYIKDSTLDGTLYLSNNKNLKQLEVYLRGDLSNSIIYLNEIEPEYVNFTLNEYETSNFNRLKTLKSNLYFDSSSSELTGDLSYTYSFVGAIGIWCDLEEFLKREEGVYLNYFNDKYFLEGFPIDKGNVTVEKIKNAFNDEVEVNTYNSKGEQVTDNNAMAFTGMKVEVIKKGDEYYEDELIYKDGELIGMAEILIYGDVNGDGKISSSDALQIIKNKNQKLYIENEANYLAGQVTEESRRKRKEPSAIDALAIIKHLNGRYEIKQNVYY